jgi:CelD/BcsL family acetyltransferase involved in cellulose biosynthesis
LASAAPLELLAAWQLPPAATYAPRVELVRRSWREFADGEAISAWDALAGRAAEPNPFYESWYLLPSLRACDPAGKVELLCLEANGELVGLLPLRRERDYYGRPLPHWRNWLHPNTFLGAPLVARGCEDAFWRELLGWCDAHAGPALFLHLAQMPADGPLHCALAAVIADGPRPATTVLREERAMLLSSLDPEEYFDRSLTAKKRKELRRQHRRLEEEGALTTERSTSAAGVAAWAAEFLALEQAGWKGKAGSALASDPVTARLFVEALAGAARRGRLERLAIRLDGQPLAMLATFLTPPGAFSFKTAFDERFARFSPGVLLQRKNLELLACPGIDWADSCASPDHPMIGHFWRERRAIAAHSIAIGGTVRQLLFRTIAACETGTAAKGIA